jgi:hypothetical protein
VREGRFPGYAVLVDPVLGTTERDTFTCAHFHQQIVHVEPYKDPASKGGICPSCGGLICKDCVGKPCMPAEYGVEQIERCKTIEEIEAVGNAIIAGRNPWRG